MFGWFRSSPRDTLKKKIRAKLAEAHTAGTKNGDRALEARLYAEVAELERQLEAMDEEEGAAGG